MQYSHNEIHCEQFANTPHSPTKHTTNNPQIHHIHQRNTQRTIRKYTTPTNETRNEQSANTQLPPTKLATNTPTGVGADSSCPYFCFTTLTLFCFHVHIFVQPYSYTLIIEHAFSFPIVGIISNTLIFYLNSKRTI